MNRDSAQLALYAQEKIMIQALKAVVALLCVALVVGCGGGDNINVQTTQLRVLHASPDAPNVDVYVDSVKVLSNVPYPTVSSYLSLPSGVHQIKVNAAGTNATVINVSPTLAANGAYTAIAANFVANIEALLATDATTTPPSGYVTLRVIHASPDAGPVDILANGQVVLSNVPFGTISTYLTIPAGTYAIKVNVAGTTTTAIAATVNLAAGSNYSAVAIGSIRTAATNPLMLKLLTDG
jgi:hypothetical protein